MRAKLTAAYSIDDYYRKSVGIGKTLLIVKSVLAGLGLDLSARQPQYEFSRRIVGRPGEVKKRSAGLLHECISMECKESVRVRFCEGLLRLKKAKPDRLLKI